MPVVCCSLHSQLAPVCAGIGGGCRVAYLQLPGGALPVSLSDAVRALKTRGLARDAVAVAPCVDGDVPCVSRPSARSPGRRARLRRGRVRHRAGHRRDGHVPRPRRRSPRRRPSTPRRRSAGTRSSLSAYRRATSASATAASLITRARRWRQPARSARRDRGRRGGLERGLRRPSALAHGTRAGRGSRLLRGRLALPVALLCGSL